MLQNGENERIRELLNDKTTFREGDRQMDKKVNFTLRIGLAGCCQEEEFTLGELGYDPEYDTDLENFLEEQWREWSGNYIDGGFRLEGQND